MNLKQILDEVMLLSGMDTETAYAASAQDGVKRLVSLANQATVLQAQYPWQALRSRYEFDLTTETEYTLPSDYRSFIPDTMYINGQLWPVDFPADTVRWSYLKASDVGDGAIASMRILGGKLHVLEPTSGDTVSFEYISKHPVTDSGGTAKELFTADTDLWRLDDHLLIKDVLWRYKKLLGLQDWQIDMAEFKGYEGILKGHDKAAQILRPGRELPLGEPYYNLWRTDA